MAQPLLPHPRENIAAADGRTVRRPELSSRCFSHDVVSSCRFVRSAAPLDRLFRGRSSADCGLRRRSLDDGNPGVHPRLRASSPKRRLLASRFSDSRFGATGASGGPTLFRGERRRGAAERRVGIYRTVSSGVTVAARPVRVYRRFSRWGSNTNRPVASARSPARTLTVPALVAGVRNNLQLPCYSGMLSNSRVTRSRPRTV